LKASLKEIRWKRVIPLVLFLLIVSAIGLGFLALFRLHIPNSENELVAHWVGNDLLKLEADAPRPQIAGHRGSGLPGTVAGEAGVIGNTERAIQQAIDSGADWIEIDIRMSSDGELVVFHDERVDDRTDKVGKVEEFPLASLEQTNLLVDPPETILSLNTVFSKFHTGSQKWIFDVKATGIESNVTEWIQEKVDEEALRADQVMIFGRRKVVQGYSESGYDLGYVVSWGEKESFGNRFNALFSPPRIVARCEELGCRYLVLPIIFSDQELVDMALAAGIEVWVYGTDHPADLEHAAGRGITGLIVDDPKAAVKMFSDHPTEAGGEAGSE
jgi:glycerophosphoryl diester phosphodiesterase